MAGQFRRLDFDEVGFHVLDDALANFGGQLIEDGRMNRGRRGERPAVFPFAFDDVDDAVRQLFHNPPVVFILDPRPFREGIDLFGRGPGGEGGGEGGNGLPVGSPRALL